MPMALDAGVNLKALQRVQEAARRSLLWAWDQRLALGLSLCLHVILLTLFQFGLRVQEPLLTLPESIPIELIELLATAQRKPPEATESLALPSEPDEDEEETVTDKWIDLRPLARTGPDIAGFRRFVLALDCTPEMAASSPEMSDACARVTAILRRHSERDVAKLRARAHRIAIANGWVLPARTEPLIQDKIREDGEKGAPGEDVFGPWPWDAGK